MESQYKFIRSLLKEQENVILQLDQLNARIEAVLLSVAPPKSEGQDHIDAMASESTPDVAEVPPNHSQKAA